MLRAMASAQARVAPTARLRLATEEATDVQLCERVAGGDDQAFEALVLRYQNRIYAFCARMLADAAEAEDVAQEVFLTLHKSAGEFRGDAAFSTWLYRIAKNQTLNRIKYLERRGRSRRDPIEALHDKLADHDQSPPEQRLSDEQTARIVEAHLAELGEEQRTVLVLRDLEELSYEEISSITGLPLGTVKSRIHRGRSVLAERLMRIFR